MIETLLGGLLGGAFRLAPEILKGLDRQGERGHELAMQDKALEFEKLRGAQRMAEIGAGSDAAWNAGAIEALRESVAAQGQRSRVRWAPEFDTKCAKCLISLETAQKFPLQQAQLRIRHGLSDVHCRQQVGLLAVDIGDA